MFLNPWRRRVSFCFVFFFGHSPWIRSFYCGVFVHKWIIFWLTKSTRVLIHCVRHGLAVGCRPTWNLRPSCFSFPEVLILSLCSLRDIKPCAVVSPALRSVVGVISNGWCCYSHGLPPSTAVFFLFPSPSASLYTLVNWYNLTKYVSWCWFSSSQNGFPSIIEILLQLLALDGSIGRERAVKPGSNPQDVCGGRRGPTPWFTIFCPFLDCSPPHVTSRNNSPPPHPPGGRI